MRPASPTLAYLSPQTISHIAMVAVSTTTEQKPDVAISKEPQNDAQDIAMPAPSNEDSGDPPTIPDSQRVTLAILSDITAAQSSHGLKHSDYDRYRTYCTRRLSRVRTATRLTNRNPQGRKYAPRAVTPEDVVRDGRALTIPLILSERDWAFAMAVKRNAATPQTRARRAVHAHLTRAVTHATTLSSLARAAADEQTMLEAEAYTQGMRATLALEREAWATALPAYEVAHKIYTGMAGVRAGTSGATLFERKVEEISQAIRFCKYNLARSGQSTTSSNRSTANGEDDDEAALLEELRTESAGTGTESGPGISDALSGKIEAALAEARRRAAQSFGHVSWCGVEVSLRSERVREAVLTAEQECESFDGQKRNVDEYDKLFVVLNDAIKEVSNELKEFRSSAGASDSRVEELELIVAYLTYNRLQHTIDRNLALVDSLPSKAKPDDHVRMYDNLISNVSDMLALKGVDADAALVNEVNARKRLFQACRCFHLAQCYQAAELPAEAAALFDRVSVHANAVPPGPYAKEAKRVVHESRGMKCRARAEAFLEELNVSSHLNGLHLHNGGTNPNGDVDADGDVDNDTGKSNGFDIDSTGVKNFAYGKQTMLQHMDEFKSFVPLEDAPWASSNAPAGAGRHAVSVCHLPPALEAVPCKPVLFDLAIDGVRLPEKDEEREEEQEVESSQTSSKPVVAESEPAAVPTAEKASSYASSMLRNTRLGRWWSGSSS